MIGSAETPAGLLVTGINGFIGRHFCASYGGSALSDSEGIVDLRDSARVRQAVAKIRPTGVLHLAAQSSVASSFQDQTETYAINFLGTLHLLSALQQAEFRGTFVYVSSADVYGRVDDARLPIEEDHPVHPRNPYAVSKVAAEALCYQWSQTGSFPVVVVRPFNQIGPGQDRRFAIADFAHQMVEIARGARAGKLITGDLEVTRDFTDVRDTVRALSLLLENGRNGEIYNICSGRERTVRSLVDQMMSMMSVQAEIAADQDRMRPVEQRRMAGNPEKIRHHLGWTAEIPIETTLLDILKDAEAQVDG